MVHKNDLDDPNGTVQHEKRPIADLLHRIEFSLEVQFVLLALDLKHCSRGNSNYVRGVSSSRTWCAL